MGLINHWSVLLRVVMDFSLLSISVFLDSMLKSNKGLYLGTGMICVLQEVRKGDWFGVF